MDWITFVRDSHHFNLSSEDLMIDSEANMFLNRICEILPNAPRAEKMTLLDLFEFAFRKVFRLLDIGTSVHTFQT